MADVGARNMRLTDTAMIKATNTVAIGGLTLPAWLPSLATVSEAAALLVPIASLFWLILQIYRSLVAKKPETPDAG